MCDPCDPVIVWPRDNLFRNYVTVIRFLFYFTKLKSTQNLITFRDNRLGMHLHWSLNIVDPRYSKDYIEGSVYIYLLSILYQLIIAWSSDEPYKNDCWPIPNFWIRYRSTIYYLFFEHKQTVQVNIENQSFKIDDIFAVLACLDIPGNGLLVPRNYHQFCWRTHIALLNN